MDLHAVVVAPVLVRVEMLRKGRYLRTPDYAASAGRRQRRQATSPGDKASVSRNSRAAGLGSVRQRTKTELAAVLPAFYSLAGEEVARSQNGFRKRSVRSQRR